MLLYSHIITPRLEYISDFIGRETIGEPFELTTNFEQFKKFSGAKINYSNEKISDGELRICSRSLSGSQLLLEKNITIQAIDCFDENGYKAFFKTEGEFSFDILAASFYLLSRYEEYLPHQKDSYGRYAHENSLAHKENFLQIPLVNIWLEDFKKALQLKFPQLTMHGSRFTFIPTYDIDIAYSYLGKGRRRTWGGVIKSFITGQWSAAKERIKVLRKKIADPYDCYEWLHELHRKFDLKPYYFFLVAGKRKGYDKNISPRKKIMQNLIRSHLNYSIGIHPSWQSGDDPGKLRDEILQLGHMIGKQINSSRQHYIRFELPETFRQLIDAGIEKDFSMGYGSINGFRASVATPFYWYDLEKEQATKLLVYPFCFMDANSFYEQKFSAEQALQELKFFNETVRSINGTFITIWHNTFLGTDKLFAGWREVYERFIAELQQS